MENNSSVIGRLSFLANVVGDGAVAGIQQMARGTGAAMTKLASAVPAAAFATSAAALAGFGAALAGGVVAAAQFEDSFALVRKVLARATEEELTDIREAILDLSTEIPVAAGQLAQLGSIAGQLGVGVADIPQFIDTVAKLGVATNMTAEQAAFSVARLANVTGIGAENADQLANVLVRLGNNTAATESEIVLLATRFGAVGKIAGLTADQTLAFSASVRATGTEAQAGATALQKFFLALQQAAAQGGTKLNAFAQAVGMSGDEFRKLAQEDISEAAVKFVEGLDKIGASGGNVQQVLQDVGLGSVRVSKVMLSLSSDTEELRSNLTLANDEMERQSALNNEAEKRFGTLLNQITRFRNVLKAVMIDIGEGLVPVFAKFIGNTADAIAGVREFSDVLNTDTFVNATKALTGLTLALGAMRLPMVSRLIYEVRVAFMAMGEGATFATAKTLGLTAALKPFLVAGAVVAGITVITKIFGSMAEKIAGAKRNLDDFKNVMNDIPMGDFGEDFSDAVTQGLFENLEEDTQEALKKAFGSDTQNVLRDILENTSENVGKTIQDTFSMMQKNTLILTSAGTGSDEAMQALRERVNAMKENLAVVEETFGKESEIAQAVSEAIRLSEIRLEKGRLLTDVEARQLDNANAQIDIFQELLNLQTANLKIKNDQIDALLKEELANARFGGDVQAILEDEEQRLRLIKQFVPFNEKLANIVGHIKEDTEDIVENTSAFGSVLQNANDFAAELNAQLKPLEALQDLDEAQDALSDAKKEIVDLNREEAELNEDLVRLERELQELMQDGKFLSQDMIDIKEEELELAEMIKAVNGETELSYQEQLRLLKLKRQREILVRAAQQGTLTEAEIQIGAIDEQIAAIENRGVTEEDVSKKEERIAQMKADAIVAANERIIEVQEEQEAVVERLIDIEEDREDATRAVEKAQIDILKQTNNSIIAFAQLSDNGIKNMKELAIALGMPRDVLDSILTKIRSAKDEIRGFGALSGITNEQRFGDSDYRRLVEGGQVARASGGPVRIGQRGLVGEFGPELIKPMPNGVMIKPLAGGQAGGVTQNVSLNITGLPTDPIAARKIAQNIQRELNKLRGDGRSGIVR